MKRKQILKKVLNIFKRTTLLKVSALLFYIFVFLIPFQIDVVVYTPAIFDSGNFNPYTSVFYHLADIVFLLSLIVWGISIFKGEVKQKLTYGKWTIFILLMLFTLICETAVLFAGDEVLSLMLVVRLVEMLFLYLYMVNDVVKIDIIINVFIASVSFQAVIAIMQYINQGAIGLHSFGEPAINSQTPGIAKMDIGNAKIIRAYGTFQHPNILAGYLVTGIFLALYRIFQKEYIAYPIVALLLAGLILTFSRSAILALIVGVLVLVSIKNIKMSFKYILLGGSLLILFIVIFDLEQTILSKFLFTDSASFNDRVFYFSIAKKMFYAHPFGVGLGNFTLMMPDFTSLKLAPWDFQPVHNIYMLLSNEIGIAGLTAFVLLLVFFTIHLFFSQRKSTLRVFLIAILVAITVIGLFDHYPISLYQGEVLLFFIFGLSGKYIMTKNH